VARCGRAGVIRTRSGDRYKPSALRSYRQALTSTALPELGHRRLTAVTPNAMQDFADRAARDTSPGRRSL